MPPRPLRRHKTTVLHRWREGGMPAPLLRHKTTALCRKQSSRHKKRFTAAFIIQAGSRQLPYARSSELHRPQLQIMSTDIFFLTLLIRRAINDVTVIHLDTLLICWPINAATVTGRQQPRTAVAACGYNTLLTPKTALERNLELEDVRNGQSMNQNTF